MSKRILFLTPQLPYPAHQGGALRTLGLIKGLADRGHSIGLLSLVDGDQPPVNETPLVKFCHPIVTLPVETRSTADRLWDMIRGYADIARRLWSDAYRDVLRKTLHENDFDVIHVEGIEMAPYLPELTRIDATIVFDTFNAEYMLQKRVFLQDMTNPRRWHAAAYSFVQWQRLIRFETISCGLADQVLAVSETDGRLLRRLKHDTPITVVPNAITTDHYHNETQPANISHPALVFTGKMDYRPNVDAVLWFADEVLPLVQKSVPDAHFVVVGKNPHAWLDRLRNHPDITLTGFVPEIQPYLKAADIYVAPLRMGSGTRFKLLEAMVMERAVVSTRLGAEGLNIKDGIHLALADDSETFAEQIIALMEDDALRRQMGQQGKILVQEYYDWRAIIPLVEAVYTPGKG